MDIELLYKKLEGSLTSKEEVEFNQWLEASDAHRIYFERFAQKQNQQLHTKLSEKDLQRYRKEFQQKLQRKKSKHTFIRWSVSVSSAAAVILGVWFLFQQVKQESISIKNPHLEAKVIPASQEKAKQSNGKVRFIPFEGKAMSLQQLAKSKGNTYKIDSTLTTLAYTKAAPITSGQERYNEIVVDRGAEFNMVLSDGTRVWLNADSKLKYPETFIGNQRNVYLEGEAYFEVAKDNQHRFVVHTQHSEVRVYGTEFNVNTRNKQCIRTTLVSGSVAVCFANESKETRLTPGYSAEMNEESRSISITDKDIQLYTGWKNGEYYFENTTLEQFFGEVSRWYDVEFEFAHEQLKTLCFTGCISRKTSLHSILNIVKNTNYITFERKNSKIILKSTF